MAKATVTKLKTRAPVAVPQSQTDCAAQIKKLGDVQRELARRSADLNDTIAQLAKAAEPRLQALQAQAEAATEGIAVWCAANRETLTGGKGKSANLITGEIGWRQRPPKCQVGRGMEADVIETLKALGLEEFVRIGESINKEAILASPDEVRGVKGLTIVTGEEDFYVQPFALAAPTGEAA